MAKLLIPDEVLDGDIAVIARKGAGKSYALRGRVERLLELRRQVLVIDPQDIWWGLKQKADGSPGFPVIVIGGDHGDLPLDPDQALGLARFFATHDASAVIDVSGMLIEEMRAFVSVFLEELYRLNRKPLWLVLEEADVFAPQVPSSKLTREMHDQVDRIVRRGRAFGFRVWTATQRPARLSKDILTQADTLFLLQIAGPQDRAAADAWISGHADPAQAAEIRGALASLAVGEGYLWSPRLDICQRMKFPPITTRDTSFTPTAGDRRREPAGAMAHGDVEALRLALAPADAKLDQLVDQAAAANAASAEHLAQLDDKLKDELERKAYARGYAACEAEHADLPTFQDGWRTGALEVLQACRSDFEDFGLFVRKNLDGLSAKLAANIATHEDLLDGRPAGPPASEPGRTSRTEAKPSPSMSAAPPAAIPTPQEAGGADPSPKVAPAGEQILSRPQRELLQALGWWKALGHGSVSKAQLAAILDWKLKGSHLRNRLAETRSAELIDYPSSGRVELTPAGGALVDCVRAPDMAARLRQALTQPQLALFEILAKHGEMSKRAIAAELRWEETGSHLRNRLAELKGMEILRYPNKGRVALQDWVLELLRRLG